MFEAKLQYCDIFLCPVFSYLNNFFTDIRIEAFFYLIDYFTKENMIELIYRFCQNYLSIVTYIDKYPIKK